MTKKVQKKQLKRSSNHLEQPKQFNFIVVGSGLAGLLSAYYLSKKGSVLLITKQHLDDCSTTYAQGGIAAVIDKNDSIKEHIEDTLKVGHNLNNKKTVEFIISKGPDAIKELIKLGTNFTKHNNQLSLHLEGGHSHNRVVHSFDHTGRNIETALIAKVKNSQNITIYQNTIVKDLIIKNKKCLGVLVLKNKNFSNVFAGKTILATGGIGQIYSKTANPLVTTGDGIAIANRAKTKISNMEFVQFHPTTLDTKITPLFLLTEALRGEGGKLMNSKGEYFMHRYDPQKDLAGRDIVSQAIWEEAKNGQVYLDLRHIQKDVIQKKYPTIFRKLEQNKIDPAKSPVPISPATHFLCGGISTNLKCETSVKNLYAIGETADNGFHGANRLASNSLLECAVMPTQIRNLRVENIKDQDQSLTKLPKFLTQKSTKKIRQKIQTLMWNKVGIIRNSKSLNEALKELATVKKHLPEGLDYQSIETQNILECAILITKAALKRKKSVGCHYIQN